MDSSPITVNSCHHIPKFEIGQRVYAPDKTGLLYLASILKIAHENAAIDGQYTSSWNYFVHYIGWPARHDLWVSQSFIHPESEEVRIKSERDRDLIIQQRKLMKNRKERTIEDKTENTSSNTNGTKRNKPEKGTAPASSSTTLVHHCFPAIVPKYILMDLPQKQATETHLIDLVVTFHDEMSDFSVLREDFPNPYLCARCSPLNYFQKSSNQFDNRQIQRIISAPRSRESFKRGDPLPADDSHSLSKEDGECSSRPTRVRQREKLQKSNSFLKSTDNGELVGKEQSLIVTKSAVHGWGVYAHELIEAGEFIIEYRGELIGNAVADKREKIYEKAQIGSDYMFRIDASTVIDATSRGNVARYINASCDPNCFTKVFIENENKKIGIFAKRDINPGEELNYDYKFAPEKDESKRIPCKCASVICRGFMNWDKRFDVKK